jgi:pyruvate/2-oxoglutarate dehydrogenase complex dihydrolipoamide acyltransferase (E2) component
VEDSTAFDNYLKFGAVDAPPAGAEASVATQSTSHTPTSSPTATVVVNKSNVAVSPAARFWIDKLHLDSSQITGTGKHGMIVKGDVLLAQKIGRTDIPARSTVVTSAAVTPAVANSPENTVASPASLPSLLGSLTTPVNNKFVDVPCSTMRKVIAKRLSESKSQVPHGYAVMEIEVESVLALRQSLKKRYEVNVSVNDFVIKAAALALRDVPAVNAKWDSVKGAIVPSPAVDISVAVATPSGLITPIIFDADKRGLTDINKTVKDLATRAKDNKLKPEEFQGGSFSISNLGRVNCLCKFSLVTNLFL